MACPFFMPIERLDDGPWIHAPRLPLGGSYRGTCHARPGEVIEPPDSHRDLCNCGYARGRCDRFPEDSVADAVRFSMTGNQLTYVLERDCAPVEHGIVTDAAGELLSRQARAFMENQPLPLRRQAAR